MKYSVLFYPQKSRDIHRLRVRVSVPEMEMRIAFNLGYIIDPDKWNTKTCRCVKGSVHGKNRDAASVINSDIQFWEDAIRDAIANKTFSTQEEFKSLIHAAVKDDYSCMQKQQEELLEPTMFDQFDEFVFEEGSENGWSESSYKKFATIRNHFVKYQDEKHVTLDYSFFNDEGMMRLSQYFISEGKKNSTIVRYIKLVKWFLRWAKRKGYCENVRVSTEYKSRLKQTKKRVIFLTWDELMRVYNCKFDKNEAHLERARDKFCFSCFTGLRYSDVSHLHKSDITDTHIIVNTQKTHDLLNINLNKYSKAIVEKYMDSDTITLFPVSSTQKTNDYLKEVGRKCNLDTVIVETNYCGGKRIEEQHKKWELLTTHCGRRTFICNALSLGIPVDVVMKWTGHSDYKAMRPYIDIADDTKKTAMALFDVR